MHGLNKKELEDYVIDLYQSKKEVANKPFHQT